MKKLIKISTMNKVLKQVAEKKQPLFCEYIAVINSVSSCNSGNSNKFKIDKEVLYKVVSDECNTLGNPVIRILISGNEQINNHLKVKDHKKYSDAILRRCKSNWRKDFRFFKYSLEAQEQISNNTINEDTVRLMEDLVSEYYVLPNEQSGFDDQLREYVELPPVCFAEQTYKVRASKLPEYIKAAESIHMIWQGLVRKTRDDSQSTLIPMPNAYIVPGGRFREMYYWDSYFTILGLKCSGLNELAKGMVENFFYLVNQFGFIPNGNRAYYLSRSQPPFLALMAEAVRPKNIESEQDRAWLESAYDATSLEYLNNWMDAKTHYVKNIGLNRYFDPVDKKRPECFGEDNVGIKIKSGFYSHERAECASGMDFTMRFSQRCSDFIPVDLNSLLYRYEILLSKWAGELGKKEESVDWQNRADRRKENIFKYLYNQEDGLFYDYDYKNTKLSSFKSIAMVYPLWVGLVDQETSYNIRNAIVYHFETAGGILTTAKPDCKKILDSIKPMEEYQWDCPNGWAPIQLIVIEALREYGYYWDARRLSLKWLDLNVSMFNITGKFYEKYNIVKNNIEVNTSYPQQDGFGWTNGVFLELLTTVLPDLA